MTISHIRGAAILRCLEVIEKCQLKQFVGVISDWHVRYDILITMHHLLLTSPYRSWWTVQIKRKQGSFVSTERTNTSNISWKQSKK